MVLKIEEYTASVKLPILKECCLQNDWDYDYFIQLQRENEKLRVVAKKLLATKEVLLEKALYSGENNSAFIFALKQLGWKDEPEPLIVNNTIHNNQGGNRSERLKNVSTETLEELDDLYSRLEEQMDNETTEQAV